MKPLVRPVVTFSLTLLMLSLAILWGQMAFADNQSLALTGAKIYTSPTATPLANGVILIRNGKILN
jgi:hypothetical protein